MRAVLVRPEPNEHPSQGIAACVEHCERRGHELVALAPDLVAALAMLAGGEVDIVVVPDERYLAPLVEIVAPTDRRPRTLLRPADVDTPSPTARPRPEALHRPDR